MSLDACDTGSMSLVEKAMPRVNHRQPAGLPEEWGDPVVPTLREPQYSQSLERGLAILGCFSPELSVCGISDIAADLGMSRSTTHRYATTLVALGYLEQGASRKYRLSLQVTGLGMALLNATGLREHTHPYIEDLSRRSSFTVSLAVLDGTGIVYAEHIRGIRRAAHELRPGVAVGSRLPSYCTAMGKVLLAALPEYERPRVLADIKLAKCAPGTITRRAVLREELTHVREEGVAACEGELAPELQSIAVPVRSGSEEVVAALGMDSPSSAIRMESFVDQLSPHLRSRRTRYRRGSGFGGRMRYPGAGNEGRRGESCTSGHRANQRGKQWSSLSIISGGCLTHARANVSSWLAALGGLSLLLSARCLFCIAVRCASGANHTSSF